MCKPHSYNDLGPQDKASHRSLPVAAIQYLDAGQGFGWRKGALVFHFCCLSRKTERSLEGGAACGKFSGLADERSGSHRWLLYLACWCLKQVLSVLKLSDFTQHVFAKLTQCVRYLPRC